MCGICGIISNKVNKDALKRMTDAMFNRGPDAGGFCIIPTCSKEVGLGHRRLSIFDTSDAGPMVDRVM
ncbi:hypothetical protein CPT75_02375 [Butyrivibrio fibrisolvens]|uniref:Glutamine amidotransferase type-2 domain-containing protein n=1 Tax=Butyrivibrio fibrisolvens TaxID=831 RepID=A0A317FYX0_BUTFI|nr:hypothetical protein CPT75_02375 [Butyrivibrio fibrisolvens]